MIDMKAFQITINNVPVALVGHEKAKQIFISISSNEYIQDINVTGKIETSPGKTKHGCWYSRSLELNDDVGIKVLEIKDEKYGGLEIIKEFQTNSIPNGENEYRCSFCGRGQNEVANLFVGVEANICIDCVDELKTMVSQDKQEE